MRSYPLARHGLCLLPPAVLLACLRYIIGPEDAVCAYFTEVRLANPSWTPPMEVFTHGALFLFYPVYAFFFVRGLCRREKKDVIFALCYVAAQVLVSALLCRVIKITVGRPRPMTGGPFVPFSLGWGYQSFPSGHAGEALGSFLPLIWRFGALAPFLMPIAFGLLLAAVCFSRVYLGMHHPTDIWGGLVIGSLSGYASWALYGALCRRRERMGNKEARPETGVR